TSPVLPAPVPVSDTSEEPALCLSVPVSEQLGDCELVGDELDTLLDCVSKEEQLPQVSFRLPVQHKLTK
ncbi:zinc finger CCCH-type containing 7Ba isoform X1, partial [Tachysurus ichikawai]